MISEFRVDHFRCFKTEQVIKLALPNGEIGSGLTYLVGKNNAGKTTVLEGMHYRADSSQYGRLRNSDIIDDAVVFSYYDSNGCLIHKLTQIRNHSYSLKNDAKGDKAEDFVSHMPVFIPSRRYWSSRTNGSEIRDIDSIKFQTQDSALRQTSDNYGSINGDIAGWFYHIEHNDDLYKEFVRGMKIIFPSFRGFTLVNEDFASVSYTTEDGITHKTDFLGDGVSSVMRILATIIFHKDRLIIIDEPELSLHPEAQQNLLKILADYAKNTQILIATHSAKMVSWVYFKNGAKINRVTKINDSGSIIKTLAEYPKYKALLESSSWNQPYIMDVIAKEIFFSDDILFLEGQEDVGLLRTIEELSPKINLFGYGVRGFNNFDVALKLAEDLGILRAGVILDNGTRETKEFEKLCRKYAPKYIILKWDREDIRDKVACCLVKDGVPDLDHITPAKNGYFTKDGKFKKSDSGDFFSKVDSLNDYFSK